MRRIVICTGVLGGGTALVFAAAALTATLIPPARLVPQNASFGSMTIRAATLGGPATTVAAATVVGPDVAPIRMPEATP